jgi:hypothetical protein
MFLESGHQKIPKIILIVIEGSPRARVARDDPRQRKSTPCLLAQIVFNKTRILFFKLIQTRLFESKPRNK